MFGIKMPWTRRAEKQRAADIAERKRLDEVREARLVHARSWTSQPAWSQPMPAPAVDVQPEKPHVTPHRHYEQPEPMRGHGGTFDGAGASGDWSAPDRSSGGCLSSSSDSGSSCGGSD